MLTAEIDLGVVQWRSGDYESSSKLFCSLTQRLQGREGFERELGRAAANLASLLFEQGEYGQMPEPLRIAFGAFRDAGDHSGLSMAFGIQGKAEYVTGEDENAIALFEMALWHARAGSDQDREAALLNNIAAIHRRRGDFAQAKELYARARRVAQELGLADSLAICDMGMVSVHLGEGNLDEAIELAEQCIQRAREIGLVDHVAQTRGNLAFALLDAGRPGDALSEFRGALVEFESLGLKREIAFTKRNIAERLYPLDSGTDSCYTPSIGG